MSKVLLAHTADLILFATATRARIITTRLSGSLGTYGWPRPYLLLAPYSRYLINKRLAVIEEASVSGAKVVQPSFAIGRPKELILRASTVAHGPDLTSSAVFGQSSQFRLPKCRLRRTLQQFDQWSLPDIPKTVFSIHEVVT